MIVCLTGPTCTGKTTMATRLASELGWPLRSCGLSIRERAASLGISMQALGDADHRAVDAETVEWALDAEHCLVEGRFLDSVFRDAAVPVAVIRLDASHEVRAERGRLRGKSTFAVDDILRADAADAEFRARLYPWAPLPSSFPVLDNSELTVDACVRRVRELMGAAPPPAD